MNDVRGGDGGGVRIRSAEAEHIQGGDGLGPLPCAQNIADDASQAGIRPCVGFNGGGVVVRLRLQADGQLVVQSDEAGVVVKRAEHEARLAFHDLLGRLLDVGLEQAVHGLRRASVHAVADGGGENAVLAVFRPGLGDHFQFHIGGVAVHFAENLLDDFHVLAGQGKLLLLAELEQLVAAQVSHGNGAVGFGGHIAGKK